MLKKSAYFGIIWLSQPNIAKIRRFFNILSFERRVSPLQVILGTQNNVFRIIEFNAQMLGTFPLAFDLF